MLQEVLHNRFEQFSSAAQQKTSKTDMDYHLDTLLASSSRNAKVRASAALATQLAEPASGAFARAHSAHLGSLVVVAWRAREAGDGARRGARFLAGDGARLGGFACRSARSDSE